MAASEAKNILARLERTVAERKSQLPAGSYTTTLLRGGTDAIGRKVIEEAAEVVQAAGEPGDAGRAHLVREAADLVFHLLVLLGYKDVELAEVEAELARREGISGLEEKAARGRPTPDKN